MSTILTQVFTDTIQDLQTSTGTKSKRYKNRSKKYAPRSQEAKERLSVIRTIYAREHREEMVEKGKKSRGVKRNYSPETRARSGAHIKAFARKGGLVTGAKRKAAAEARRKALEEEKKKLEAAALTVKTAEEIAVEPVIEAEDNDSKDKQKVKEGL